MILDDLPLVDQLHDYRQQMGLWGARWQVRVCTHKDRMSLKNKNQRSGHGWHGHAGLILSNRGLNGMKQSFSVIHAQSEFGHEFLEI